MKTINNKLIMSFNPCYNPSEIGIDDNETLTVVEWIEKYRNRVKNKEDIIWLLCRNKFMSDHDLRLFAVWCAREVLKLVENPDKRSINSCDVAELFLNGKATQRELTAAWDAAMDATRNAAGNAAGDAAGDAAGAAWAAWAAAGNAARNAARNAASNAAWAAAGDAARAAVRTAQINQLLTYFK